MVETCGQDFRVLREGGGGEEGGCEEGCPAAVAPVVCWGAPIARLLPATTAVWQGFGGQVTCGVSVEGGGGGGSFRGQRGRFARGRAGGGRGVGVVIGEDNEKIINPAPLLLHLLQRWRVER